MSKKDYERIAATIRELFFDSVISGSTALNVAVAFADMLEANHPRDGYPFNRTKFLEACK